MPEHEFYIISRFVKMMLRGIVTLYAVWQKEITSTDQVNTWADLKYMQNMISAACTSAPSKTAKTLTDSRDNSTYSVTKLDDGKCWMTQNLKLDISTAGSLNSSNSNLPEGTTWPSSALPSSNSGFSSGTEATAKWNNGTGVTNANTWNSNYGYYYNWCAATAGQGRYCTGAATTNNASEYSICPKGWRLPANAEYSNLLSTAGISNDGNGSTKIRSTPYNFPYAGYVNYGSLNLVGSQGYYWSSTANSSSYAYRLAFLSGSVNTYYDGRYFGYSVRCIAQ